MFEIYQSEKNNKYYFRLRAGNGEIILSGQAYQDKEGCEKGVGSVKKHADDEGNFETKEASDGRHYFVLKAANGQVIGQSQRYKSASGLKNGIASVGENAPSAEVKDLT